MKNLSNILLIGFTFALAASCNKIDDLLTFRIDHQSEITIAGNLPITAPIEIATPDIETNSNQEFQNNDTRADLVKDVTLEKLRLTIIDPANETFSFLESIHIYISADGQPELELAHLDNIETTSKTLDLETTSERLDAYVKASSYNLRTKVITRKTLTSDVTIETDLTFKVTAEPL